MDSREEGNQIPEAYRHGCPTGTVHEVVTVGLTGPARRAVQGASRRRWSPSSWSSGARQHRPRRRRRLRRAGDAVLHEPHVPRLVLLVRLAAVDGDEPRRCRRPSGRRSTSLLRIPATKRSPAVTASRRPRSRATWPDSTPRARPPTVDPTCLSRRSTTSQCPVFCSQLPVAMDGPYPLECSAVVEDTVDRNAEVLSADRIGNGQYVIHNDAGAFL